MNNVRILISHKLRQAARNTGCSQAVLILKGKGKFHPRTGHEGPEKE